MVTYDISKIMKYNSATVQGKINIVQLAINIWDHEYDKNKLNMNMTKIINVVWTRYRRIQKEL